MERVRLIKIERVRLKPTWTGRKHIAGGGVWSGSCITKNGNALPDSMGPGKTYDEIAEAKKRYWQKQREIDGRVNATRNAILRRRAARLVKKAEAEDKKKRKKHVRRKRKSTAPEISSPQSG